MKIGMLWFDNDPKSDLKIKIERAATYYQGKYGQSPNLCFIHPSMLTEPALKPPTIEVRTTASVLPNHFWIGVSSPTA